jgi:hypothetical protein
MNRRLVALGTSITALTLAEACAHPRLLGSGCKAPLSRGAWEATAQEGRIEGQVRDAAEDIPIGNITVRLDSAGMAQVSDAEGHFAFTRVPDGRHVLSTDGTVYRARVDTVSVLPRDGLRGTLYLTLPKDVLRHCELYRP